MLRPRYPDHAALIERDIGCPRIRPEEVAGACLEDVLPAGFDRCESNGHFLVGLLRGARTKDYSFLTMQFDAVKHSIGEAIR